MRLTDKRPKSHSYRPPLLLGLLSFSVVAILSSLLLPDSWVAHLDWIGARRLLAALIGGVVGTVTVILWLHFVIPHPLRLLLTVISACLCAAVLIVVRSQGISKAVLNPNPNGGVPGAEVTAGDLGWPHTVAFLGSLSLAAFLALSYCLYHFVEKHLSDEE